NLDKYQPIDSLLTETTLFDNIIEVGVIFEGKQEAIVLNSIDDLSTGDALLNEQNLVESYRQIDIYSFSKPDLFKRSFSPFIQFNQASLYCVLDNFFVFANSKEMLQNIIANYQNRSEEHTSELQSRENLVCRL